MSTETCHTCDYDEHCSDIQRDIAYLERDRDQLAQYHETAAEDVSELIILENMPKITPASAKRETGGRIGTRGDVHISLLSKKRGITVEKAAETIYQKYGPEGEGLLQPEFDERRIRNEIIDILQMGKANYRAQFIGPVAEKELDIVEKQQQFVEECVGDVDEPPLPVNLVKSRSGALGYMATRLKMAERGDFRNYNRNQVLQEAIKFNSARLKSAIERDSNTDSQKRLSPTPENLIRWMKEPGKYDLIGVDTYRKDDPTADLKIKKEIFWHRLLKK